MLITECGQLADGSPRAIRPIPSVRSVETARNGPIWVATTNLSLSAGYAGDHDEAVQLARQAEQITAGIFGTVARLCSSALTTALAGAGDLAEAERAGAAGLAQARDAGDLLNEAILLPRIVDLNLRAGRTGDAAAHLALSAGLV